MTHEKKRAHKKNKNEIKKKRKRNTLKQTRKNESVDTRAYVNMERFCCVCTHEKFLMEFQTSVRA